MCVTYKNFCGCCCNVVTCSIVFAILGLIIGGLNVLSSILSLTGIFTEGMLDLYMKSGAYGNVGFYVFCWIMIAISLVWMLPDILLLMGVSKKKPGLMIPWLVVKMILLVLGTLISVYIIVILAISTDLASSLIDDRQFGAEARQTGTAMIVIYAIILALFNALGYYVWDIVKSAYKQIKNENENDQSHGNYAMQSYEKPPPYNYSYQQV